MRYLTAAQLSQLVPSREYCDLVRSAYQIFGEDRQVLSQPSIATVAPVHAPGDMMSIKGAVAASLGVFGVFFGVRGRDYYLAVSEIGTGKLLGVVEQSASYRRRTAATALVSASYFAPSSSRVAAVIGSGGISAEVVRLLPTCFKLDSLRVASRTFAGARTFVDRLKPEVDCAIQAVESIREAVAGADIVITITSASEPFITEGMLAPGSFICSLGGGHEIDIKVMSEIDRLIVDDIGYALWRGDFKGWLDRGEIARSALEQRIEGDIGQVALGKVPPRQGDETILAVIQGMAISDLVIAHTALERARLSELGGEIPNDLQFAVVP